MKENLLTIRGLIHHNLKQYDLAETAFQKAIQQSDTLTPFGKRSHLIVSLYYLGEIHILKGNKIEARLYFSRAATPDTDHPLTKQSRNALKIYKLE